MATKLKRESPQPPPVGTLGLSRRSTNALLTAGIRTIPELIALSPDTVFGFRNVGLKSAKEINEKILELRRSQNLPEAEAELELWGEHVGEAAPRPYNDIPAALYEWPIEVLGLPERVQHALRVGGIASLGELAAFDAPLRTIANFGATAEAAVERSINQLTPVPRQDVFRRDTGGHCAVPRAPLEIFRLVEAAHSVSDEIDALAADLSERTKTMLLQRITSRGGRRVTLEEVADQYRISRERVRQLTEKREALLRDSGLWLPLADRVAQTVEQSGGILSSKELRRALARLKVDCDPESLQRLEVLSEFGLLRPIKFEPRYKVWLAGAGLRTKDGEYMFEAAVRRCKRGAAADLGREGCIAASRLDGVSLDAARILDLAFHRRFERVSSYYVPRISRRSGLLTIVEKMLALTNPLRFDDLWSGLRKADGRKRNRGEAFRLPPRAVVQKILQNSPTLTVENGLVSHTAAAALRAKLSGAMVAVESVVKQHDGVATWEEIMKAVSDAGFSRAYGALMTRDPAICRYAWGLYGIRGRSVDPDVLRRRAGEEHSAMIRSVSVSGGRSATVVYALTQFSLTGVLPWPSRLGNPLFYEWRARMPDARVLTLRLRNNFLWTLRPWLRHSDASEGDLLIGTFNLAEGTVEFDLVPGREAA